MSNLRQVCVLVWIVSFANLLNGEPKRVAESGSGGKGSRVHRSVTGPTEPINLAIAAGATATFTFQPVPPKTLPATSYPPGSSIVGQTLTLGSVPARVWIESELTGWAPDTLGTYQIGISAHDPEMDGAGYLGSAAQCAGHPVIGAGDLRPAQQACPSTNAAGHSFCSGALAGRTTCASGLPVRCMSWDGINPDYLPAGLWCSPGYQDYCHPKDINLGIASVSVIDISTVNFRWGMSADPGEIPTDFMPSYLATIVLDVPADAKGTYTLDAREDLVILRNTNPPGSNDIPIAEMRPAVIQIVSCTSDAQCNDNNGCTADVCQAEGCCTNEPVASWDPVTECCNPANGVQAPIPQSTGCRIGMCSMGGSLGVPITEDLPDGTTCLSTDPCYGDGLCVDGACEREQYAGPDCLKSRFISLQPEADGQSRALRVRLVSLHDPDPPYGAGPVADFSGFEGETRWVGAPNVFVESSSNSTPVHAAEVGCAPHYQDWSVIDLLHVYGAEILPDSVYEVQSIEEGLDVNVESNYSPPVSIATGRWGDVVSPTSSPGGTVQPDFSDVAAVVDKFRSRPGSISKPRALLMGSGLSGIPDLSSDVDFIEIAATNDAFRGRPYPFTGPLPCP